MAIRLKAHGASVTLVERLPNLGGRAQVLSGTASFTTPDRQL